MRLFTHFDEVGAKNDRNDALAVLTALRQPDMRFVSIKSVDQHAMLAWHRMRQGWSEERTTLINRIRGPLAESGFWMPRSTEAFNRAVRVALDTDTLPGRMRTLVLSALEQLASLEHYIAACELEIKTHVKLRADAQRVSALMGIGPITATSPVTGETTGFHANSAWSQPCRPLAKHSDA